ncbi:TPA: hypothetical protein N0F65_007387 [Lagenidium giganteum]|uniref:Uncharacterized protein n=1 Tax=Lagenidium giganteum TaxID=4803 RepID=A0AAV2ZRK2_9STRA|nr:TPA: hypothetical protein N0F65_007387 [Lagenidium giganteum]
MCSNCVVPRRLECYQGRRQVLGGCERQ